MPRGRHPQGVPLQLSSLGVMPGGGHPQGVPLPIVFFRRYAWRRAPTRGAPTDCLLSALCLALQLPLEEGAHKGSPYRLSSFGVMPGGGHPQGVPLPIVFFSGLCLEEGTHKGSPYNCLLSGLCLRRAPTRGAPTDCLLSGLCLEEGTHKGSPYQLSLLSALCLEEGTHKGRPYRLSSFGVMPRGGHPQGVPLPIVFFRRYA